MIPISIQLVLLARGRLCERTLREAVTSTRQTKTWTNAGFAGGDQISNVSKIINRNALHSGLREQNATAYEAYPREGVVWWAWENGVQALIPLPSLSPTDFEISSFRRRLTWFFFFFFSSARASRSRSISVSALRSSISIISMSQNNRIAAVETV